MRCLFFSMAIIALCASVCRADEPKDVFFSKLDPARCAVQFKYGGLYVQVRPDGAASMWWGSSPTDFIRSKAGTFDIVVLLGQVKEQSVPAKSEEGLVWVNVSTETGSLSLYLPYGGAAAATFKTIIEKGEGGDQVRAYLAKYPPFGKRIIPE